MITSAPSLPTHPPRPGPCRAISGDLAQFSGDLGAAPRHLGRSRIARRHTCSKKEGPGWSHGAHVLARGAPCAASLSAPLVRRWRGPVRRRPAPRRVHRATLFCPLPPQQERERVCERGRPQSAQRAEPARPHRGNIKSTCTTLHVMQHRPIPRASSSIEVFQEELRRCV